VPNCIRAITLVKEQPDNRIRFSLFSLLGVFAYVSCTLALASFTNSVALGVHLTLLLVGWLLWRYAYGHGAGIILVLLGGHLLLALSLPWVLDGTEDFLGFRALASMAASLIVMAGLADFVWEWHTGRPYARNQLWIAATLFCVLIVGWAAIPTLGNAAIARRQASDTAANNRAAAKAIALVEAVLKRTGAAPKADALRELLPEPLPSIRWQSYSYPIQYRQTSNSTYQLSYIDPSGFLWGDIITFDSATPQRGWFRIPF
jgi:hypothetical protein